MLFSHEELMAVLKRHLPESPDKDLEGVASSIVDSAKNWQEVDLHTKLHDQKESEILHDICKRHEEGKEPKKIRLFFKH